MAPVQELHGDAIKTDLLDQEMGSLDPKRTDRMKNKVIFCSGRNYNRFTDRFDGRGSANDDAGCEDENCRSIAFIRYEFSQIS